MACKTLARPTESEKKTLASLFPASSYAGKRLSQPFNPSSECCVNSAKKKKKSAIGRSTSVQVVVMPGFTPNLPRGKSRATLVKGGRQKTLQFRRSMTPLQVKNKILQEFKVLHDLVSYMECNLIIKRGYLTKSMVTKTSS